MLQGELENTVIYLEKISSRNPVIYKLRLILFALLGYLYIALVTLAALAILALFPILLLTGKGAIIFIKLLTKLGIPLLLLIYTILRSLWVRFDPPSGIPISRKQAPQLFGLIDRMCREMKVPYIHQVLINDEFNACVAQIPRLGFFGWYKNYLVIGLPLMLALSPEQFEAVLAHEFGHISRFHGRMGAWIYRTRCTWNQLSENLERSQYWGSFIFKKFFQWFAPRFWAYSFVMARTQEYEADKLSAEFAGKEAMAASLIKINVINQRLQEEFWPELDHLSENQPDPIHFFKELTPLLSSPSDDQKATTWMQKALSWKTNYYDTHPCLTERLDVLKVSPVLPQKITISATMTYLAEALTNNLAEQLTSNWQASVRSVWSERFQNTQRRREELKELKIKVKENMLTAEEHVHYALLMQEFEGVTAAMPIFAKAYSLHNDYAPALYHYGRTLLEQNNEKGIDYISQAGENDWDSIIPGANLVCSFLVTQGNEEAATAYWAKANERWTEVCLARKEREELHFTDHFIKHDVPDNVVLDIGANLKEFPQVTHAYLAKKDIKHLPEYPLYILLYEFNFTKIKDHTLSQLSQEIINRIEIPGHCSVVPLTKENYKLKKLKKIPNSLIYRKKST